MLDLRTILRLVNDAAIMENLSGCVTTMPMLMEVLRDPKSRAFGDAAGAVLVIHEGGDVYEWHWVLTPAKRGRAALELAREALEEMFTVHGARAIYGITPRVNRAARSMNRALGALPTGTTTDTLGRECIVYTVERASWVTS